MNRCLLAWTAVVGFTACAAYSATNATLTINGTTVDADYTTKNGAVYVLLSSVGKALKASVQKTANGYKLVPEGGANQVEGIRGKLGQTLNAGYATVKVVKVIKTDHYKNQFTDGTMDPLSANEEIVAVVLHVKNATNKTVSLNPIGDDHTALVDDSEHAYPPIRGIGIDVPNRQPRMLPGSAVDFALTFSVPRDRNITALVYGIDVPFEGFKSKTFRISLKEQE